MFLLHATVVLGRGLCFYVEVAPVRVCLSITVALVFCALWEFVVLILLFLMKKNVKCFFKHLYSATRISVRTCFDRKVMRGVRD